MFYNIRVWFARTANGAPPLDRVTFPESAEISGLDLHSSHESIEVLRISPFKYGVQKEPERRAETLEN